MIRSDESILEQALQFDNAQKCAAFLDQACADEPALRQRIETLLKAFPKGAFLESPVFGAIETLDMPRIQEQPGSRVGRYKLLEQIGTGGMGIVYMAEQTEPVRRRVALKVVKPGMDTQQVIARFEAERQAIALMDHPNIAKVHDGGVTESGRPFFVMELVRGMPITEYCDHVRSAPRIRLELFVTVCQAVAHAHQKGIIHRDIKPSNVLVTLHDGAPIPKVIDFGIAKAINQQLTEKTLFTGFGQLLGTPLYMSPEQAEISGLDVDTRSDVYSLGVLLYELLTGQTPFDKDTLSKAGFDEMRRIIREDEPLRPSQRVSTVKAEALSTISLKRGIDERRLGQLLKGELDWIVMKAMEKDRNRRYESPSAMAADIQRYLQDQPVEACPPTTRYRLGKFVRRNRVAMMTAGLVSAALVLGLALSIWQAMRAWRAEGLAYQRLQQVTAEKVRADEERAIAVAVNEFIQHDLLAQAEPSANARTKKITVEEVLGRAADRIADKFKTQPRIEAAIQKTIGDSYGALGNYASAQTHLERAMGLSLQLLGEEHADTLTAMHHLASIYQELGQYVKAEPLLIKVLETRRRTLGENHRYTLSALNNLALNYHYQSEYSKAEPLYAQTVEILRHVMGEKHADTAMAMRNLANIYKTQGLVAQAEPLFVDAAEIHRSTLGEEHPTTIDSINGLAVLYSEQMQYAKAEPLMLKTLEISQRVQGEEHPATLLILTNLAALYRGQGQFAKAQSLMNNVVEVSRRVLGEEHPDTLSYVQHLASALRAQSKYSEALPLLYSTLEIQRRVLGETHSDTLQSMNDLASLHRELGEYEKAAPLLEKTVEINTLLHGAENSETLRSMNYLGRLYSAQKEYQRAEPLFVTALEISQRVLGHEHSATLFHMNDLAEMYQNAGQDREAEPLFLKTLEIRRRVLGNEHPDTLTTLNDLALLYMDRHQFVQAEPICLQVLEIRRRVLGDDHGGTNVSRGNLAGLYYSTGRYIEAESLYRETVVWSRAKLGLAHPSTQTDIRNLTACYARMGEPEKCETLARELILFCKEQAGVDSPQYADELASFGLNLLDLKKYAEAESVARECLVLREKLEPDDWKTFNTQTILGGALFGQGQYAEAEPHLLTGYQGMKEQEAVIPQDGKLRLIEAIERLVQLYDTWGRNEDAARWRREMATRHPVLEQEKEAEQQP